MNKLKALTPSDWLIVAGGAIVLVFGLLRWFSWEVRVEAVVDFDARARATPSTICSPA